MKPHLWLAVLLLLAAEVHATALSLLGYYKHAAIWKTSTVAVCWETTATDAAAKAWVKDQVTKTWQAASAVTFTGWNACPAQGFHGLRVGIADVLDPGPHTVALGRELDGIANGMVLDFTFQKWGKSCASPMQREFCIRAIAAHEFGHALGFAHEQLRKDTPSNCNEHTGEEGDVTFGLWDQSSIMNYCNPQWNGNGMLSDIDRAMVRAVYGARQEVKTLSSSPPPHTCSDAKRPTYCCYQPAFGANVCAADQATCNAIAPNLCGKL